MDHGELDRKLQHARAQMAAEQAARRLEDIGADWVLGPAEVMVVPRAGFEKLYFDSLVFEPDVLEFLCKRVGAERIMLGSDWPFPIGDFKPADVVRKANLPAGDKAAILGGTAAQILGL